MHWTGIDLAWGGRDSGAGSKGAIAAVELPGEGDVGPMSMEGDPYHNYLLDEFGVQVPVFPWRHHGRRYIRISAQLYNSVEEYEFLAECLEQSM